MPASRLSNTDSVAISGSRLFLDYIPKLVCRGAWNSCPERLRLIGYVRRAAAAGRRKISPGIIDKIKELMEREKAGDPMTDLKWTRRTTSKIARAITETGIRVSPTTVRRILKDLGCFLRVNCKKISSYSSPARNAQFENIAVLCERFSSHSAPVIIVDTKEKEVVGNFKNSGPAWHKRTCCRTRP
jgi:Rhodopirellula transposase DDE domain